MKIQYTIDKFEDERVVLKDKDNNMIIWPKDKLPADCTEGMVLNFEIDNNQNTTIKNNKTAKEVVNEILNNKN